MDNVEQNQMPGWKNFLRCFVLILPMVSAVTWFFMGDITLTMVSLSVGLVVSSIALGLSSRNRTHNE